jgi:soluble lytic murein transglycosylase
LALHKAEALLQSGDPALAGLAQMELREIRPKDGHESEFLVRLANLNRQAGSHLGAFAVVTELIQRGAKQAVTEWAARIIFPIERWSLVLENSGARRIDPVWVLSLMKQESAFDVGALSSSGAVGLMQVMPATAVETDPKITRVALSAHAANIRVGTTYMSQMLDRFRGNITLATAAYNAGPVAVERWMKEFGLKDVENGLSLGMIEFIESIPYKETRDYVGSIIRNYYWYSRRLPQEVRNLPESIAGPQPLQYFWVRNVPAAVTPESSQK